MQIYYNFLNHLTIQPNYYPPIQPHRDALAGAQQEGAAEGAVTAEAALMGQILGTDRLSGSGERIAAADEVVDAQVVDVGVVGDALA